jgi:hypothetical protein
MFLSLSLIIVVAVIIVVRLYSLGQEIFMDK